ncbi:hypothetical protein XNA1_5060002 [Xenorhabdus nematophila str. Anatoliense]|nr:hypothetical protein XNA1_5060002 [Xenorhabdus nematophila str. Anatoliense]
MLSAFSGTADNVVTRKRSSQTIRTLILQSPKGVPLRLLEH